jgi:hypothetical protein
MTHIMQSPSRERTADQSASRIHAFQSTTSAAFVLAGATMGAVIGATVGVLAGPPGMWSGAVLGAVAGAAAGRVMNVQEARTSRHDAELDEAIGVTSRNLGRPPFAELAQHHRG